VAAEGRAKIGLNEIDLGVSVFGGKPNVAYRAIKKLMRGGVAEKIAKCEQAALDTFIETWFIRKQG
jgi:hypothetical protein